MMHRLHLFWLLLVVVVVAGLAALLVEPPLSTEPPGPVYVVSADGVRIAQLDLPALTRWCRSQGLPDPPALGTAEPAVAEALIGGLLVVAREPNAHNLARMGMICESLDCHNAAIWYFQAALRQDARDFRWRYYLACSLQASGRNKEAIDHFLHALPLNSEYATTYARLGQLYLEDNDLEKADQHFQRYVQRMPQDSLGYVGLARIALARRELDQALPHAINGVQRGPNEFHTHHELGKVYAALGRDEEARRHLDICASLPKGLLFAMRDPLDQELNGVTADAADLVRELEMLRGSQEWARMAELTAKIVERRPGDATMLTNLAGFHRKLKRYDEAHRALDRAERVNAELAIVHESRAELLLAEGRTEEAAEAAGRCLALDPRSHRALGVRGRAMLLLRRVGEAVEALQRCVDLRPDEAGNVFVLGEALRAAGRAGEAAQHYERVLTLSPDRVDARQRLAEINAAGGTEGSGE